FDNDEDDDFNRILTNSSESTNKKTLKRKNKESDSSSLSVSSDTEHEGDRWSKNKENLIKKNLDLSKSCNECKNSAKEIDFLKERVSKLEKVYNVIKRNSIFDQKGLMFCLT
ncbi:unnamed protein product, partial [Rotaria sordida]